MCCSETIFIVRVHAVWGLIYSVWIVWHCVLKKLCMCVVWANSSIYSTHTYFDIFHSFRWQPVKNNLFNQTDHTPILATQTRHNTRKHVCITLIHCTLFTFFLFFWNIRGLFFQNFPSMQTVLTCCWPVLTEEKKISHLNTSHNVMWLFIVLFVSNQSSFPPFCLTQSDKWPAGAIN